MKDQAERSSCTLQWHAHSVEGHIHEYPMWPAQNCQSLLVPISCCRKVASRGHWHASASMKATLAGDNPYVRSLSNMVVRTETPHAKHTDVVWMLLRGADLECKSGG